MVALKVRFDGKVLVPKEPIDLPCDVDLMVYVDVPVPSNQGDTRQSVLEWMVANSIEDSSLPTDLAHQHDHYLYGTPKKKE
jgi:hypothetical protein